jgi:erythromycin esterase
VRGRGTAWFDGLELEAGGRRWADGPRPRLQKPGAAAISWVRRKAIPFTTPAAGNGFDDLRPLKILLANARVVSLGEGTHGTSEFFQMKHRLLEYLATEMGFNYFSIEANMPEAERVNQYVLTGVGDPRKLLQGLYFWTWNTQEVLDMIEWMRAFNASGKGPVQFTGFDLQYSAVAAANARAFLSKAEPGYVATADSAFARVAAAEKSRQPAPGDVEAAQAVYDHFVERRGDYLSRFPAQEVDWAVQNARVVLQDVQQITGIVSRDESMAENAGWILDHAPAGSKIVLWAHNGHVSKEPGAMGSYLARRYGTSMYVLGFSFGEGRYNAIGPQGLRDYEALPPVQGSLETLFEATRLPRFILDVRNPGGGEPGTWLNKPQNFRSLGAVAFRCAFYPIVTSKVYDGLIWINPTSPSALLPFQ